jgi:hypothetical protein
VRREVEEVDVVVVDIITIAEGEDAEVVAGVDAGAVIESEHPHR